MNTRVTRVTAVTRVSICALFAASLVVAVAPALGSFLPAEDEVPEMMMETQGLYCIWLGTHYGPSEELSFTSNTDIANRTFNFALVSASTYAAQPATISGSGAFNSSTNQWDFTVNASVGANNFSSTGTGEDPPFSMVFDFDPDAVETIISNVTYSQTATRTVSEGTFTIMKRISGEVQHTSTHYDTFHLIGDAAGEWEWNTTEAESPSGTIKAASAGFSPVEGGAGQFTTSVTVPEPRIGLFVVSSLLIGARAARRAGR